MLESLPKGVKIFLFIFAFLLVFFIISFASVAFLEFPFSFQDVSQKVKTLVFSQKVPELPVQDSRPSPFNDLISGQNNSIKSYYTNYFSELGPQENLKFPNYIFRNQDILLSDGKIQKTYGAEFIGQIENFEAVDKLLTVSAKDQVYLFDLTKLSQLFSLDRTCNDIYNFCPEEEKDALKLSPVDIDTFSYTDLQKDALVRIFLTEIPQNASAPPVLQLIYNSP